MIFIFFSKIEIYYLKVKNEKCLLKILRTLGKKEDPTYAANRQAIGLKLFQRLIRECDDFIIPFDVALFEHYSILETLAIYLENEREKHNGFHNRKAALIWLKQLFHQINQNLENSKKSDNMAYMREKVIFFVKTHIYNILDVFL